MRGASRATPSARRCGCSRWRREARRGLKKSRARTSTSIRVACRAGEPGDEQAAAHPLAESAGGDPHHDGGKHWTSKDDPEWQTLAAWVRGETLQQRRTASRGKVRIIQTNSAGDNVHIIDPADEQGRRRRSPASR